MARVVEDVTFFITLPTGTLRMLMLESVKRTPALECTRRPQRL
jgi:hypothetical protein